MLVVTTYKIEGYRITEYKGIVRGLIVRAPTILQAFSSLFKNIIGGTIGGYTTACETARAQAYDLMVQHAAKLGANAILGMRYDAANVSGRATEVICYGTAVVLTTKK